VHTSAVLEFAFYFRFDFVLFLMFIFVSLLGPFHGAIAVPSVTRSRCCGHRCAGGARQYR